MRKIDCSFAKLKNVVFPYSASPEDTSGGKEKKPSKTHVETIAIVRILLEISPSFIGKTTATNLSIAIHTKLWTETRRDTELVKI